MSVVLYSQTLTNRNKPYKTLNEFIEWISSEEQINDASLAKKTLLVYYPTFTTSMFVCFICLLSVLFYVYILNINYVNVPPKIYKNIVNY